MLGPLEHIHKKKIKQLLFHFPKTLTITTLTTRYYKKNGKMKTEITVGAVGFAILLFL